MKILLIGAKGQVGRCFMDRAPSEWEVLATDRSMLDITCFENIRKVALQFKPSVILNMAAYTAVDRAENEIEKARQVNVEGPKYLAQVSKMLGSRVVHISTDYVFDGQRELPYSEQDSTNPQCVYGKTKRDGENALLEIASDAIIIRTSWVFSEYGNNFVKTMLKLGAERSSLGVVADQRGCPTYAGDLANAIIKLLIDNAEGGIYHFCGDQEVSWSEFAESIFSIAAENGIISRLPVVNKLTSEQYATLAKRPKYSTLSCDKINALDISRSDWRKKLGAVIHQLASIE